MHRANYTRRGYGGHNLSEFTPRQYSHRQAINFNWAPGEYFARLDWLVDGRRNTFTGPDTCTGSKLLHYIGLWVSKLIFDYNHSEEVAYEKRTVKLRINGTSNGRLFQTRAASEGKMRQQDDDPRQGTKKHNEDEERRRWRDYSVEIWRSQSLR